MLLTFQNAINDESHGLINHQNQKDKEEKFFAKTWHNLWMIHL